MAVKISLDNVIDSTSKFELDFYFLKINGNAELNARLTFLALMDLEKFYRNPYTEILSCLNEADKQEISDMSEADAISFIRKKSLVNDLPTIESISNSFMRAMAENKSININMLFKHILSIAKQNNSLNVEFMAEADEDGISVEQKQNLVKEIMGQSTICDVADLIFMYYKKDMKNIYESLTQSVYDFLLQFK